MTQECHLWVFIQRGKKKDELIDTGNKSVVARGEGWGVGGMDEVGQRVQTTSYQINKPWDVLYSMVTVVNDNVLYNI